MSQAIGYILAVLGGAFITAIAYKTGEELFEQIKRRWNIGRKKGAIDLSGPWIATWSTTVEGELNINSERIDIKHSGNKLTFENKERSEDNRLGGYLWSANAVIYDNDQIVGYYLSKEKNVTSKGSLYFVWNHAGNFMMGRWVGCNYDYELTWGLGVIAETKEFGIDKIDKLLKTKSGIERSDIDEKGG